MANLVSGFLCSIPLDDGWPFIFYIYGSFSALKRERGAEMWKERERDVVRGRREEKDGGREGGRAKERECGWMGRETEGKRGKRWGRRSAQRVTDRQTDGDTDTD